MEIQERSADTRILIDETDPDEILSGCETHHMGALCKRKRSSLVEDIWTYGVTGVVTPPVHRGKLSPLPSRSPSSYHLPVPPCPSLSLLVPPCPALSLLVPPWPSVSRLVPLCTCVSLRLPQSLSPSPPISGPTVKTHPTSQLHLASPQMRPICLDIDQR